ncbi:PIN domain-containing protein [Nocardia panacis]|uniref:Ribonuclease VapC n=1 Tax=Nocardia panacis TaxID=2340916 RepID=A0A3A4K354_9NOCA|nr:PIN domain-containing protein [Nocardia panacis]
MDTSATARFKNDAVRRVIAGLIADGAAATTVTVDLEAGYSGRSVTDVQTIAQRRRALYVNLPINESIAERAREIQQLMARKSQHRAAGIIDILTAATAEFHGAVLVHYDADFEHIAAVTRQPHVWVVPQGSVN